VAARATWKGSIRLSLITIPIRVFPATKASDVSFRQLHRKCHTPIQLRKWCPHCEREVNADEIVKGYESSKGHFVLVETEEIEKLRPESTHVIDIGYTVSTAAIDPIYIERSYYLAPDGKTAGGSFAVLREGLGDRAGVGRLSLHGREYLVAILPKDDAILMYTLRTAGEVVDVRQIDQLDFAAGRVKPEEVKLAKQILQHFDTAPDLSAFTDHYQQALRALLKSKGPAEAISAQAGAEAGKPKKVVDLMDALRKSLAEVTAKGHKARIPARRVRVRAS
jgi:DNA end-binding protein Ku